LLGDGVEVDGDPVVDELGGGLDRRRLTSMRLLGSALPGPRPRRQRNAEELRRELASRLDREVLGLLEEVDQVATVAAPEVLPARAVVVADVEA